MRVDWTPQRCEPVRDVHELCANDESVALPKKSSSEDGADLQVASNFLRIGLFAFVAEDCAARSYAEIRKLRQVIREALADAIAEILHVGVGTLICERNDREGIDCCAARTEGEEPDREDH